MKKIIGFIITICFVAIVFYYNSAKAALYFPSSDRTVMCVNSENGFNAIAGTKSEDIMIVEYYEDELCSHITSGNYKVNGELVSTIDSSRKIRIELRFTVSGGAITDFSIILNDDTIFKISDINEGISYDVDKEKFLPDYFDNADEDLFLLNENSLQMSAEANAIYDSLVTNKSTLRSRCFNDVLCKKIECGSSTKGKKVYYLVDNMNPINLDTIKADVKANDSFDGNLSVRFSDCQYKIGENGIAIPGEYLLRAVASDSCGNTSFLNVYIKVIDITGPSVFGSDLVEADYLIKKNVNDYIDSLICVDPSGVTSITVKSDDYSANYNKKGTYTVEYEVKDYYGNSSIYPLSIEVVDKTPPVITIPNTVQFVEFGTIISKEELTKGITIVDDYDGEIKEFQIDGYDAYLANPNSWSTYIIRIIAFDKTGNKAIGVISLNPRDTIYPDITVDSGYTLIVQRGTTLTQADLKAKLEAALGRDLSLATLSSSYFIDENPSGKYEVLIEFEDGTTATHYLSVIGEDINFDVPIENNDTETSLITSNNTIIIYIASAIIGLILIMGIVLYKKKH